VRAPAAAPGRRNPPPPGARRRTGRDRRPLWQHGQQIAERREDRETHVPAVAVLRPEQRHLSHDIDLQHAEPEQTLHGLGYDEADVMCEAVSEPLLPLNGTIGMSERGFHPNGAITYLDRAIRYVVCPQVESAPAFKIEASVVPMVGQDAVFDGATVKREAHVRAAVIEGEDASLVVDDEDGTVGAVHDEPPLRLELLKATCERKFLFRYVHEHTSRSRPVGAAAMTHSTLQ
jgi:hypothetical protein